MVLGQGAAPYDRGTHALMLWCFGALVRWCFGALYETQTVAPDTPHFYGMIPLMHPLNGELPDTLLLGPYVEAYDLLGSTAGVTRN